MPVFAAFQMFYSLVCPRVPFNRVGAYLNAQNGQYTHHMPIKLTHSSDLASLILLVPSFSGAST